MGFTTSCFIRKSTKELTEKVYKLGGRNGRNFWHCDYLTLLLAEKEQFTCLDDERGNAERLIERGYIDCGTNEEFFLAIAALRDDTSANQYWVFDQDFPPHYKKGDFTIGHFNRCSCYCHVATVNELIEHFKGKED